MLTGRHHLSDPDDDLEYGSRQHVKTERSRQPRSHKKQKTIRNAIQENGEKFDSFYKQLGSKCKQEDKRIDFVLVHPKVDVKEIEDEDERTEVDRRNRLRQKFEAAMKAERLQKQHETIRDKEYTKLHCPFKRLCEEAEAVTLEMPLHGCESEYKETKTFIKNWIDDKFVTDNEVDMVSAPFQMDRMHLYANHDDPTNFFRPAIRSLLVEHILINIDLRCGQSQKFKHAQVNVKTVANCWGFLKNDEELGDMQKVGLDYMKLEEVYIDTFILHEESNYDPDADNKNKTLPQSETVLQNDSRLYLQLTWTKFFKFQPLWKIRNYFGENIAFYFAWSGTLISTLWLPMLFGLAIFIYGLVRSIEKTNDTSQQQTASETNSTLSDLFKNVKESFDNDVTPYYALFISVWGTLFLEIWKRKQSELAYQWDVEQFEENEPDRPEFYGTKSRLDPVTNIMDWYYPFTRQAWKLFISTMSLLFMVCLVMVSVMAVIVYRVVATVDYCPNMPGSECLLISTLMSSVLNAISILILGKLYDMMAWKLTDWENHRTETRYNDSLIIKLFAFQFANNYASCFYIAFFRGRFDDVGILGRGPEYTDDCEGTCMSQLSFQILVLMLTKPLPKFIKDIIIPWLKGFVRRRCQCCACIPFLRKFLQPEMKPKSEKTLLEIESEKPSLGNFTLPEYTEKIIQYGLMMLFAASFPLAPLLALLTNLVDLRIDAWRMLWWYQRPMATIAEDIGTWYVILTFMNFCGVVSNAFLIAFTSGWGSEYDTVGKLWIVIGFEHIVFSLKFLLAYLIPDVPAGVVLAIRKKRYQLNKKIEEDNIRESGETSRLRNENEVSSKEGAYISREESRASSPWRKHKKQGNEYMDEDNFTEVRKMKKKKKSVLQKDENNDSYDNRRHSRDESPADTGRLPPIYGTLYTKSNYQMHDKGPQG